MPFKLNFCTVQLSKSPSLLFIFAVWVTDWTTARPTSDYEWMTAITFNKFTFNQNNCHHSFHFWVLLLLLLLSIVNWIGGFLVFFLSCFVVINDNFIFSVFPPPLLVLYSFLSLSLFLTRIHSICKGCICTYVCTTI